MRSPPSRHRWLGAANCGSSSFTRPASDTCGQPQPATASKVAHTRHCAPSDVRFSSSMLLLNAEAVQVVVERGDVDAAVRYRKTGPMIPGSDLIAAGPQFLAGLGIQPV